jgi:hypothetical protein
MVSLLFSCSNQQDFALIPVQQADKWGYINPKGLFVVNPQFEDADFFYDGLARVENSEGKTGYINKSGKFEIAAIYKYGTAFCEGFAFVVSDGGPPTCIDKKGNVKFVLKEAERVFAFSEGLALFINSDDKYGFVDKNGNVAINPQFEEAIPFFEGFAAVKQNKKWGFIGKDGKLLINPQFERVLNFKEGKAAFYDGKKWGFIDTKGAYVINPQYSDVFSFSEGLARVEQGDKYGFINTKGEFEINPQFDDVLFFLNGLSPVKQGKTSGYLNKQGKYEINPQFDDVWFFYGDIAPVESADKWGFIDKKGKYVINPQFESVKLYHKFLWSIATNLFTNVKSDYYDATSFINIFFKKNTGSLFDGFNESSTLNDLSNNSNYGDDLNAVDKYTVSCYPRTDITKDISLYKVSFHFDEAIYKEVATYDYYWGYSYQSGTKKEYDFDAKPFAIKYEFDLSGKAYRKAGAVANAIKTEIEQNQKLQMESKKGKYYLFQDNGFSFVIEYTDYSVYFYVGFSKSELQEFLNDSDWNYEE